MYQKSEIFLGNVKGERDRVRRAKWEGKRCYDGRRRKAVVRFDSSSVQIIIFLWLLPPQHPPTTNEKTGRRARHSERIRVKLFTRSSRILKDRKSARREVDSYFVTTGHYKRARWRQVAPVKRTFPPRNLEIGICGRASERPPPPYLQLWMAVVLAAVGCLRCNHLRKIRNWISYHVFAAFEPLLPPLSLCANTGRAARCAKLVLPAWPDLRKSRAAGGSRDRKSSYLVL